MRIDRLTLDCYGHFRDRDFDLSGEGVRLHIVHGPNEAGKSTTLSAIGDLLFGFPHISPYNFRYNYDQLAVSGTLTARNGERLSFRRRKNGKILIPNGAGEVPADGSRLLPFLGGADRGLFERMFGLDHARLRQGGRAMLEDGGDLARLLFEAGSGLSGAMALLDRLEAEADAIASLGRQSKNRRFNQALESFRDAHDRLKHEGRSEQEWNQEQKKAAAARSVRDAVAEELAGVRARRHRIHRLLRVLPALAALDEALSTQAALGAVPDLPDGFEDDWRAAQTAARTAAEDAARAQAQWAGLAEERERCGDPGPLPALADDIRRLHREAGAVGSQRAQEPALIQALEAEGQRLAALVQNLGLDGPADTVADRVPPQPLMAGVRERMDRRAELVAAEAAARRRHGEAMARAASSAAALEGAATAADPAEAAAALEEAGRLGDTAADLAEARRLRDRAAEECHQAMDRLDLWTAGVERLAATPFPDADTVRQRERDRTALDNARTRKRDERDTAYALCARLAGDLAEIQAVGPVPTPDAVREARRNRDRLWRTLRTALADGSLPADPALPDRFEESLAAADALADRQEQEAQRVARFATLSGQNLQARMQRETADAALAAADADLAAWERAWADLWAPTGLIPADPAAMLGWLGRKDEVLRLADAAARAASTLHRAGERDRLAAGHRRTAALALGLPADSATATLRAAVTAATERRATLDKLRQDHKDHRRDVDAAAQEVEQAAAAVQSWQREWAQAMPSLGLPPTATPAEAAAALALWDEIRGCLDKRRDLAGRLAAVRAEGAAFAASVAALVAQAAPALDDITGRDGLEVMAEAVRRLADAQERAAHCRRLDIQCADARTALDAALRAQEETARRLAALRRHHGLEPDDDAIALARTAAEARKAAQAVAKARAALADAGDGLAEADLRRDAAGHDPDSLKAESQSLDDEERVLQQRKDEATSTLALAEQRLGALRSARDGEEAEWQARDAARTMGDHARQWMRLRAAALLLAEAVERYRATNEQPLLKRASGLLAAIAAGPGNPIVGLKPDYGRNSRPVLLAERADGTTCAVEGMSEGTRDQLFLALRIAAIEQYAAEKDPLPFIADDLFITSDEDRTVPGLQALAELGGHTQVILFTHHRYVVDTAAACLPAAAVRVHRL